MIFIHKVIVLRKKINNELCSIQSYVDSPESTKALTAMNIVGGIPKCYVNRNGKGNFWRDDWQGEFLKGRVRRTLLFFFFEMFLLQLVV